MEKNIKDINRSKAKKIIEVGQVNINKVLLGFNNFLEEKQAILQMTLCFYPDSNIRFEYHKSKSMFNTSDVWFNGDISVGMNGDITIETVNWKLLENILTINIKRRNLLKNKVLKIFTFPPNMTVRNYLEVNFHDNLVDAATELDDLGNTYTGALYNHFLNDGSELKIDFFTELEKLYKKKIHAEF